MEPLTDTRAESLLFRRQFLLGPRYVNSLPSWKRATVGDRFFLQAHPDLGLTQIKAEGNVELTLLGYLIDPDHPGDSNEDVLRPLATGLKQPRDLFKRTARLGGRWILIADDGEETLLFHDPCGFRQVHYTEKSFPQRWCTSQPKILQEELGLEADPEAISEFVESPYFENEREPWWPGNSTLYREVRRLLPNHYLDLRSWTVRRFWPWENIKSLSLEEGVERAADLLRRLVLAANARFDLALSLTAGFDSRTLLAAAREISTDVYYFTTVHYDMTRWDPDVRVPAKLLSKLGLEHHVIDCPSSISEEFAKLYRRNVGIARDGWGTIAQGMYERYPRESVWMKGNCADIARHASRADYSEQLDGKTLAAQGWLGMGENAFAIKHFNKWLEGAREVDDKYGYNLLEVFYWEQRMGSWQAGSQAEMDLVQEAFAPYNCRTLLETLLAVDVEYRCAPRYELFRRIILHLWKEALNAPINPVPKHERMVKRFREVFKPLLGETIFYRAPRKAYRMVKNYIRSC